MTFDAFVLLSDGTEQLPLCPDERARGWLTRGVARACSERLARRLREVNTTPRRVVVALPDRYALLIGCLAVWRLGAEVVLPPNLLRATVERVRRDSDADCIIGDEPLASLPAYLSLGASDLAGHGSAPSNSDLLASAVDGELDIPAQRSVVLLYTSGTTGAHQCCLKSAAQVFGEARTLAASFEIDESAVVAATVPGYHLYGLLFGVLAPLLSGARFLRSSPLQPVDVEQALNQHSVTHLVTVPTHLQALDRASFAAPASLRRVFSSGAVLERSLASRVAVKLGARVIDVLGSTESGGIGFREPALAEHYQTFPGVRVAVDVEQRLLLNSVFARGTNEQEDWRILPDRIREVPGGFVYLGRDDGVVKVGAKRVTLQELEARARAIAGVNDAAALRVDSASRGQEVWLAVASSSARFDRRSLRDALSPHFEAVLLPRRYLIVAELPLTPLGKLDRDALLRHFEDAAPSCDS